MAWVKEYRSKCFVGTDMYEVTLKYHQFLSELDPSKHKILAVNHSSAAAQKQIYRNETVTQVLFTILVTYSYDNHEAAAKGRIDK